MTRPKFTRDMKSSKIFRAASVSKNTNSFGLSGIILVAKDGEAFEAASYCMGSFQLPVNSDVALEISNPDAIDPVNRYSWVSLTGRTFEIPRALPSCPAKVLKEIFTAKA